jgi:hypothetical protein
MPRLTFNQSIAAGATFDAMAASQYRYLPWHARIRVIAQTTAAGINMEIDAGAEQLQPPSPIDGTGAAGKLPTVFTVDPIEQVMAAGDLVQVKFTNTTAGALSVTGVIDINPA